MSRKTRSGAGRPASADHEPCPDCGHAARPLSEWAWLASMVGASPGLWNCGEDAGNGDACACTETFHFG